MSVVRERVGVLSLLSGLGLAAALAVVPHEASAGSYVVQLVPHTFQAIPVGPGPVTSLTTSDFQSTYYTPTYKVMTLPFTFPFYEVGYTQITLMGNGTVSMGATTYPSADSTEANADKRVIPSTTGKRHNFIAVWQDLIVCDSTSATNVKTQVVGQPGDRFFVIEWNNCRKYAVTASITAQLWLGENGTIEAHYGTASSSSPFWVAGMGIENADGTDGTPGLSINGTVCNPNCGNADFPTNHKLVYISKPLVSLDSISVDKQQLVVGQTATVNVVASNAGKDAPYSSMRFWISPSAVASHGRDLGVVSGVDLLSGTNASFSMAVDTTGMKAGTYYIIAEFDPFGAIVPLTEARKVLVSSPITVKDPAATLRVTSGSVSAPGWVASGSTFDVSWNMDNNDSLNVAGGQFLVVLSTDTTVDDGDVLLGVGTFSLNAGAQLAMTKTVTIPAGVPDGKYYVGVWLDPYSQVTQTDRSGNKRMSVTPTTVGLDLKIVTSELPGGRVGDAYSANLVATGGDSIYAWTVAAGALPQGLSIVNAGGVNRLSGTPSKAGVSTFTLQATSAQFTKTATYSVEILPALIPVEIVTGGILPAATLGSVYTVVLEAHGGTPPYSWSIDSGMVPAGLALAPNGRFGGTPTEQGSFPIFVKVTDGTGVGATTLFTVDVVADPLVCSNVSGHAPVMVGEAIRPLSMIAAGGVAPYRWSTSSGAVPGLTISDAGEVSGTPTTAGTYDWTVEVADANTSKVRCHVALEVTEQPKETELVISTSSLPNGEVAVSYTATLEATGFTGTVTWSLGEGTLPEGLFLTTSGSIRGVPSPAALGGEKTGTFRFEVVAVDSAQKEARATFDLELADNRPAPPPVIGTTEKKDGKGCQSTSGDAGLLALGLALGVATLVRRRG